MSSPTSPQLSPRKGKFILCKVYMLDDSTHTFQIPHKALGKVLFEEVAKKLHLLESDYFDLEYLDHSENYANEQKTCWLDHEKPVLKQLSINNLLFKFLVKFYTPDPGLLEDEFTRYLFALQIKRDLATGAMPCQEHTAVLLASYIVQSEIGDFIEEEYTNPAYLEGLKLLPNQTEELDVKIMEHHREHVGQTPAEADFNLLDTARKVELYGIRMHPAKDHEGVPLHLAVAHMGVLVFQSYTKINTFSWAKVRKLSFKRKKFLIKLHPDGYQGYYKDTVEFYFETRNECKNFWKKCIEHHAFFRCHSVKRIPRNKTRVVSRGSSFRYSGKTQKQLVEYVRDNYIKRPPFERKSTSLRTVSTTNRSMGGTLNSREFPHNTSSSTGSHTLERSRSSRENLDQHQRSLERADVHNGHVKQQPHDYQGYPPAAAGQQPRSPGGEKRQPPTAPPPDYMQNYDAVQQQMMQQQQQQQQQQHDQSGHYGELSPPTQPRIDPSKFMLTKDDRKMSAPAFPVSAHMENDDHYLSRSPEVENIPDRVQHQDDPRSAGLTRTQSATQPDHQQYSAGYQPVSALTAHKEEDSPPPPPPPIYQEDGSISRVSLSSSRREETLVSRSSASAASATITSGSMSLTSSRGNTEDSGEEEGRRKRFPADKAYYIAKELLMTERTYQKDLEVITVWFRNVVSTDDLLQEPVLELLFRTLDPLYDFHVTFLKEIDTRLHMWEGKSNAHLNGEYQRIGDIMLNGVVRVLQLYRVYMESHEEILRELEAACKRNRLLEAVYKDFEAQKVCYLPLSTFLLKPAQRLLHYRLILERLLKHYPADSPDRHDCQASLSAIGEVTSTFSGLMTHLENLHKLIELQRDLVGLDSLVMPNRHFIREGCLQKLSRKGYQQRMFFLFSDMLVYTSRTSTPSLQFKVHGHLPLKGMIVDETDAKMAVANSFTIYGGNRCLVVTAASPEEKAKWQEDLLAAIAGAARGDAGGDRPGQYASLKSNSSSVGSSEALEDSHDEPKSPGTPDRQIQHRANTTMHVCWHRNTSVSMRDHNNAIQNQLSGYLLRKFKNSNGWQKLWVVFTNFCLFFYKTYQDDFPLASLPLLGYSVTTPTEGDGIHKEYVFKLQFKNHVYFFRAESEYIFERWIEVITSATSTSKMLRMFSRLESSSVG